MNGRLLRESNEKDLITIGAPKKALLVPKFAHGVSGTMNSGLPAIGVLPDGKVMQGNSRFKKTGKK